jgi:Ni/Fe-hydrogenase subunit HybB-like protein
MAGRHARLTGAPLLSPLTLVLGLVAAIGVYFIGVRFLHGIGAVTNINAGYPWGIWVVGDVVIGTAFGCGGFAMALLVYVFNEGRYSPLMRPALLGGLFGYTLAGAAVIIDLGRWHQFYNLLNPFYMQPNSVMLEIGLCVMAYVTVLWIEFSPAILERFGLQDWRARVERWMWLFIAAGVVLPTMHQSSLGSALLVLGAKLSPLYYTPILPVLFVTSALAMGYAVVVFEATVVGHAFRRPSEHALLARLGRVVGWIVVVWLALRWGDLILRGAVGHAFEAAALTPWFWLETLLAVAAAACFLSRRLAADARATFAGGVALLLFGSLYRVNAYLVAYRPVGNYEYFPSVPELMVTFGVVALEILLYLVFVKVFPVLHAAPEGGAPSHAR